MKTFIITLMLMTTALVNAAKKEIIIPESAKQEIISTIEMENLMGARQLMELKQKFNQQQYKQNTTTIEISDGTASISGNVVDGLGTPILDHQVSLWYWETVSGFWAFQANTQTDTAGDYTFDLLAANTYIVEVGNRTDDYLDYIWNVTTASQELCSGCARDLVDNGIILADAAVITNIDFQAPLGGVIEGSITDSISAAGNRYFCSGIY
ncbi:MAG: carboxypeptidase-like regulatory domain-containing protein [Proteobacteria bacterium]|nr:carboxypeptidase-like regulatory domain-containing protein [Pseudomonadota bacterium]